MDIAKDFIILRGIQANGRVSHPLDRRPVKVATLLDEGRFNELGQALLHNKTVFLEDQWHDWTWEDGRFRYFTRVAEVADVLVVFEIGEVFFCTECGGMKASLADPCAACGH